MSVADWVVEVDVPQPSRGARANLARRIGIVASIVAVGALIVFAQRIGVGVIVAGAIAIGGTLLPGELPHVDTPDTFPGAPNASGQIATSQTATPTMNLSAGITWKVAPEVK